MSLLFFIMMIISVYICVFVFVIVYFLLLQFHMGVSGVNLNLFRIIPTVCC